MRMRFRFRAILVVAALIGLAILASFWWSDTPLDTIERKMVGVWSIQLPTNAPPTHELFMELRADRTVRISGRSLTEFPLSTNRRSMIGRWHVGKEKLVLDWQFVETPTGFTSEMGQKRQTLWERLTEGHPESKDRSPIRSVSERELELEYLTTIRIWHRVE